MKIFPIGQIAELAVKASGLHFVVIFDRTDPGEDTLRKNLELVLKDYGEEDDFCRLMLGITKEILMVGFETFKEAKQLFDSLNTPIFHRSSMIVHLHSPDGSLVGYNY